jgi:hypothetical protein
MLYSPDLIREFKFGEHVVWDLNETKDPVEFQFDDIVFLADKFRFIDSIEVDKLV